MRVSHGTRSSVGLTDACVTRTRPSLRSTDAGVPRHGAKSARSRVPETEIRGRLALYLRADGQASYRIGSHGGRLPMIHAPPRISGLGCPTPRRGARRRVPERWPGEGLRE